MSDNEPYLYTIPRYGNAGVAFLGVDVNQTIFLIASIFVGIIGGAKGGMPFYIGAPAVGYFGTRIYLDWTSNQSPGSLRAMLYRFGFAGYSSGLRTQKTIYLGDSMGINPIFDEQVIEIITPYLEAK